MIRVFLVVLACSAVLGCSTPMVRHSGWVEMEVAHFSPSLGEAVFLVCSYCPGPTPKTQLPLSTGTSNRSGSETGSHTFPGSHRAGDSDTSGPEPIRLVARFQFDSSMLSPRFVERLRHALNAEGEVRRIEVTGFTDATGPVAYNDRLALRRADAVRRAILHLRPDLDPSTIEIDGRGSCCYEASNRTAEGRRINRRVVTVIHIDSLVDRPVDVTKRS